MAINTAGRAVLFAGTTVVISLLGMLIMGLAFVNGLAIGAAMVVFVTMIASVTLLPALLGFVGARVEVTRWRGLIAAGLIAVALFGAGLGIRGARFGRSRRRHSCSSPASSSDRSRRRCRGERPSRSSRPSRTDGAA